MFAYTRRARWILVVAAGLLFTRGTAVGETRQPQAKTDGDSTRERSDRALERLASMAARLASVNPDSIVAQGKMQTARLEITHHETRIRELQAAKAESGPAFTAAIETFVRASGGEKKVQADPRLAARVGQLALRRDEFFTSADEEIAAHRKGLASAQADLHAARVDEMLATPVNVPTPSPKPVPVHKDPAKTTASSPSPKELEAAERWFQSRRGRGDPR